MECFCLPLIYLKFNYQIKIPGQSHCDDDVLYRSKQVSQKRKEFFSDCQVSVGGHLVVEVHWTVCWSYSEVVGVRWEERGARLTKLSVSPHMLTLAQILSLKCLLRVNIFSPVKYHQINQHCGPFLQVTVTWCFRQSSTHEHRCSQWLAY